MSGLLVIGYGNTVRSDDGAGPAAARAIRDRYPEVDCISIHGLEPVLAETIGHYDHVVFIDAAIGIERMSISSVEPARSAEAHHTHMQSPESLLRMSKDLYDTAPSAVIIRIPAFVTDFGETMTRGTETAIGECIEEFGRRFIRAAEAD